jgi:hypothetical protein
VSIATGAAIGGALEAWVAGETTRLAATRPRLHRILSRIWMHPAVVLLPLAVVVGGIAGFMRQDGDQVRFRAAGAAMLGPGWLDTFDNSWIQVGPVYLAALGAWDRLGGLVGLPAVAIGTSSAALQGLLIGALALAVAGRAATLGSAPVRRTQWVVGTVIVLGGVLNQAMYADHPEELILGLVAALAAVEVGRGRRGLAALLLGLGTGVKTWTPVAAGVLVHGRRLRAAAVSCAYLAVIVALAWGPFFLWGRVSTFDLSWILPTGSWYESLAPSALTIGWGFRLMQAGVAGVAGALMALRRHGSVLAPVVVALATRLLIDPIRLSYYWTALAAVLVVWLWTTPTALGRRVRLVATLALPVLTLQPVLPTGAWWNAGTVICVVVLVVCVVAERRPRALPASVPSMSDESTVLEGARS